MLHFTWGPDCIWTSVALASHSRPPNYHLRTIQPLHKQHHHLRETWTVEKAVNARAITSMEECVGVQNSGSLQTTFARLHPGLHPMLVTDNACMTVASLPASTQSHLPTLKGHRRSHPRHLAPSKTHASSGITVHAEEAQIATDRTRLTRLGQSHLLLTTNIFNLARSHSALFVQICLH